MTIPGSRMRRQTYWLFQLCFWTVNFVTGLAGTEASGLAVFVQIATTIGSLITGVRRMHDTDHSGWYLFIPFYGFILAVQEGTRGPNRFGPDPKNPAPLYPASEPPFTHRPNLHDATRLPERVAPKELSAEAVDAIELEGKVSHETERG